MLLPWYIGAEGALKGIELEARLGCVAEMMFWPTFGAGLMTVQPPVMGVHTASCAAMAPLSAALLYIEALVISL